MSGLARDTTAEPVSRGQFLRRERRQEKICVLLLAEHTEDLLEVDLYYAERHNYNRLQNFVHHTSTTYYIPVVGVGKETHKKNGTVGET